MGGWPAIALNFICCQTPTESRSDDQRLRVFEGPPSNTRRLHLFTCWEATYHLTICGLTHTDWNHSQTDCLRFANNCHLIYKCRQTAKTLQSTWVSLHWWAQFVCETSLCNKRLNLNSCQLVVFWLRAYIKARSTPAYFM